MADEFHLGSGNWWDSTRNRVESTGTAPTSVSTRLNDIAGYEWPPEMVEMKSRSSMESESVSGAGMDSGSVLANTNLQMMGFGLSSPGMDWNQSLSFRGEKSESSFRCLLQEDNFQRESGTAASSQEHWRQNLYAAGESSGANSFRQMDHPPEFCSQASSSDSTITSHNLNTCYPVDSAAAYGLRMPENQPQQHSNYDHRSINYPYQSVSYGGEFTQTCNRFPQFWRTSPPKHPQPPPSATGSHLHFTNNTPFWNASSTMNDARSGFFPTLPTQIPLPPSFDEKPKNTSETHHLCTIQKKNTESSNKRPRNEASSPLPACNKVKKEKMADRITALQQLVSPFGKTDTASVLSEAIEYIKFLHEQVSVLSNAYMKNGGSVQKHQQILDKSKDPQGPRQDLRSRGLCLVPVSSTFPVTQETSVDFWTPTFGSTYR